MNHNRSQVVADYVMESSERLLTAMEVWEAHSAIQREVIRRFGEKLEKLLLPELSGGWRIQGNSLKTNPAEKFTGIFISNTEWPHALVGICNDSRVGPLNHIFGVNYGGKQENGSPFQSELKSLLDKEVAPGKQSPYWEWYRYLDHPYLNWQGIVLVDLLANDDVANRLVRDMLELRDLVTRFHSDCR